ncbi:MAG: Maf family protein [Pseudomonadota bacterium]
MSASSKLLLLLGSSSPRRRELLAQIGIQFDVVSPDIDEAPLAGERPEVYADRMSREKATAIVRRLGHDRPILCADTVVTVDQQILGKPLDKSDCIRMLMALSGREHQVSSSVTLIDSAGNESSTQVTTQVRFRTLDIEECERYWLTGEPRDKAGSYGIQGRGAIFIAGIHGSYSNVVGLPLFETATLLRSAGIARW